MTASKQIVSTVFSRGQEWPALLAFVEVAKQQNLIEPPESFFKLPGVEVEVVKLGPVRLLYQFDVQTGDMMGRFDALYEVLG